MVTGRVRDEETNLPGSTGSRRSDSGTPVNVDSNLVQLVTQWMSKVNRRLPEVIISSSESVSGSATRPFEANLP